MVKNIGIDINSLDTNYDELNNDEDVVISRGVTTEMEFERRLENMYFVNDYFVVKFELEEDMEFVLTGGSWIIAGQYLLLHKWRPGFCPATAHITRRARWICVSAKHLECFDV
ncbi:PREDICTED: reverse mRNAase [Prunus dulcis]|uniref:PREDICTED: reverse mRNAase n=1 Tax=Prunus dulcis TaxID=3755 RepID=A0A5E4GEY8_PRUDU|nr:PREDICTED: reverse mRNAase [Prunus dulcis]